MVVQNNQLLVCNRLLHKHIILKAALTEAAKKRKFGKLADVTTMPKNMGQRLTQWHFFTLLDDRNLNDQGIDARGVQIRNGNMYGSSKDIGINH